MIRREISKFELIYSGGRLDCQPPCSLRSLIGREADIAGGIRLEARINVKKIDLTTKYLYLRLSGLDRAADVYVDDKFLFATDGTLPVYHIDLGDRLVVGENVISVRLSDEECYGEDMALFLKAEILCFANAAIESLSVTQQHSENSVQLDLGLSLLGKPDSVRAVATLTSPVGQMYFSGLHGGRGSIIISDPLYWWPAGQGVQNIYTLTLNIYGECEIEDSYTTTLGLRTAKGNEDGNIWVNGMHMIPMGALYIPECDTDFNKRNEKADSYVKSAAMSNYNCLVIPSSAPLPSDRFYSACDERGIMVIEEHSLLDLMDLSVVESIKHRSHHPSLCVIDVIDSTDRSAEIENLADELGGLSFRIIGSQPEYLGLPALPSMKTICEVTPEDERGLFSHYIESIAEPQAIRDMLLSVADRYPYPTDLSAFGYASAMASAHKVGDAVKESRLSYGKSGRAVFNRLNDPRIAISASAIDARGRWKPLQYYSSRHFAPIALYADYKDGKVDFSVSSQRRIDLIGSLEYRIADASNRTVMSESVECEITSMTSTVIHTADIGEIISGHEREYYLEFYLKEGSDAISRRTLLFVPEKHFKFKKPRIKTVVSGEDRNFSVTLSADCFVKDMEVCFDGIDVVLDDNYFDITSEAPVKVCFTVMGGMEASYRLKDALELRSVVDLIK
ncbi:MAG: hypothetical protein J6V80_04315 [Clostridia bacterium]|nr:hypothetical protein [Clostridia bacterium]